MTHRRRRARTTLPIALAVLLAGGCMPGGSSAQDSSSGSAPRLRVALNFPPVAGLSPYSDDAVLLTRAGITESLVRFDKDGTPQPALAQSFSMVGDRTARFVLRKGVTFHDGTPMDAQAVAGALTRAISAKPAPETVSGRPSRSRPSAPTRSRSPPPVRTRSWSSGWATRTWPSWRPRPMPRTPTALTRPEPAPAPSGSSA